MDEVKEALKENAIQQLEEQIKQDIWHINYHEKELDRHKLDKMSHELMLTKLREENNV